MLTGAPITWHWAGSLLLYTLSYPLIDCGLRGCFAVYPTLEQPTQVYITSNLLKAAVLAGVSCVHASTIRDIVLHDRWNPEYLAIFAPWYASLDLVSLWLVDKMAPSTAVHHVLVGLCGVYASIHRIEQGTVAGQICIYALFSSVAWFVNGFLGARHLIRHRKPLRRLAKACGLGYAAVCAGHWAYQAQCVQRAPSALWAVPLLFGPFVYDDLVLMRWLIGHP